MHLDKKSRKIRRVKKYQPVNQRADFKELMKLLDEIRSSFVIARYFISLNKESDLIHSSIEDACEKFEKVKNLLVSFNGFMRDEKFMQKIGNLEKEISLLKKIA